MWLLIVQISRKVTCNILFAKESLQSSDPYSFHSSHYFCLLNIDCACFGPHRGLRSWSCTRGVATRQSHWIFPILFTNYRWFAWRFSSPSSSLDFFSTISFITLPTYFHLKRLQEVIFSSFSNVIAKLFIILSYLSSISLIQERKKYEVHNVNSFVPRRKLFQTLPLVLDKPIYFPYECIVSGRWVIFSRNYYYLLLLFYRQTDIPRFTETHLIVRQTAILYCLLHPI